MNQGENGGDAGRSCRTAGRTLTFLLSEVVAMGGLWLFPCAVNQNFLCCFFISFQHHSWSMKVLGFTLSGGQKTGPGLLNSPPLGSEHGGEGLEQKGEPPLLSGWLKATVTGAPPPPWNRSKAALSKLQCAQSPWRSCWSVCSDSAGQHGAWRSAFFTGFWPLLFGSWTTC